jgi:hypothetical protein
MSLALLYLRVFILRIVLRNCIYAIIAATCLQSWSSIFFLIFQCHPIAGGWDPRVKASCANHYPGFLVGAVVGGLVDLALIIIVLPCIIALRVRKRQKVGLLIVANLGWVTIIAAVLRTVKVAQAVKPGGDFTWNVLEVISWTSVECSTMMVCAAAPVIKPLLKKFASFIPARWATKLTSRGEGSLSTGQTRATNATGKSGSMSSNFCLEVLSDKDSTRATM